MLRGGGLYNEGRNFGPEVERDIRSGRLRGFCLKCKRKIKILLIVLAALIAAAAAVIGVLRFGFGIDVFDRGGWHELEDGGRQFRLYDGTPLSGWQQVDGETYYFDPEDDCAAATGWLDLDGGRYWLGGDGTPAVGWLDVDGRRYRFDEGGVMHTGWLDLGGKRYWFGGDGVMHTGWLELDGETRRFGANGVMVTGWAEVDGARYYFDEDGVLHTGWLDLDGGRYWLGEDGAMAAGWVDMEDGRRYFDETGAMVTGWLDLDGKRYWLKPDGVLHTGWLTSTDGSRWFREDGAMAIGRVVIDGTAYFFAADGTHVLLVNPWNTVPEGYTVKLVWVEGYQIAVQCRDDLVAMMNACRAAGIHCGMSSGYRTHEYQDSLWSGQVERYVAQGYSRSEAEAITSKSIAVPDTSEHQLGLAVDLTREGDTYEWLAAHSWEYGFILRYPYGKTDLTGIYYEPWHFRYVGRELAEELYGLGLCLEEYMNLLTEQAGYDSVSH